MPVLCTSCGSALQDGAAFCNQCGQQLTVSAVTPQTPPVGAVALNQRTAAAKPKRWITWVVLLIAVVSLVGGGVWTWMQQESITLGASASPKEITAVPKNDSPDLLSTLANSATKPDSAKDSTTGQAVITAAGRAFDALDPASPNDTLSPASSKDACSLLTRDELSAGVGSSFSKAEPSTNGEDEISCEYSPGEGNIYPVTLTVTLRNGKTTMATLRGVGTQVVSGTKAQNDLGDASFYMPMDVGIYALKRDTLVSLQFGLGKGTREQKQALVQKVLSRL